jgi:PAS domain S-box-containing protein
MSGSIAALMRDERGARARRLAAVFALTLAVFWGLDAIVDTVLGHGDLADGLAHPDSVEVWMRVLVAILVTLLYRGSRTSARLRLLSTALDAAPDGVQITGLDGRVAYSNRAVEDIYGFSPAELEGLHVNDMNVDPAFAGQTILPAIQRDGQWAGELEVKHKSGGSFPIWLKASLVRSPTGRPIATIGAIRDISELKRAEVELRAYAKQLEEATRLKELFADILRHDLLGPASALQMSITTLLRHEPPTPACGRLLAGAKRSCERLTEMIESAATYAKLSAVTQVEFRTIDIAESLRSVAADFDVPLMQRQARLALDARGPCLARANPMVSDVFANLLSNAIKYGPEGGTIAIGIADDGDRWKVTVADEGEGIADEDKERVFTRFERAAKEGVKGSGLGLAIARRIVDLHGGLIWIEDNRPVGSVFCVALPKA